MVGTNDSFGSLNDRFGCTSSSLIYASPTKEQAWFDIGRLFGPEMITSYRKWDYNDVIRRMKYYAVSTMEGLKT